MQSLQNLFSIIYSTYSGSDKQAVGSNKVARKPAYAPQQQEPLAQLHNQT